eukprot:6473627-Lingulodinium_polyedra.AAC.1
MTSKAPPPSLPAEFSSTWLAPGPAPPPLAPGPVGCSPSSGHASHSGPAYASTGASSSLWDPAHLHQAISKAGAAAPSP